MKKNEKGVISKIHADSNLKSRFNSFGIAKGSEFLIENCSPNKQNIEIEVRGVHLALRKEEAKLIEVIE